MEWYSGVIGKKKKKKQQRIPQEPVNLHVATVRCLYTARALQKCIQLTDK